MRRWTDAQGKEYLQKLACPHCGSAETEMTTGKPRCTYREVCLDWYCCRCGEEWVEVYELVGIKEVRY